MTRTSFWGIGARGVPDVTGVQALGPEEGEQDAIKPEMRQNTGVNKDFFMVVLPLIISRRYKNATVNFVTFMKDLNDDTFRRSFNAIGVVFVRDGRSIMVRCPTSKDVLTEYRHNGMIAHFDNGMVIAGRQCDRRRNVFGTHGAKIIRCDRK